LAHSGPDLPGDLLLSDIERPPICRNCGLYRVLIPCAKGIKKAVFSLMSI